MNRRQRRATLSAPPRHEPSETPIVEWRPAAPRSGRIGWKLAALLIVAGVALAYADGLPNGWVFDDRNDVLGNQEALKPWPPWKPVIRWRNGKPVPHPRPVVVSTFAWNYALAGPRPWAFRLTNIAIHALAALTLFGLVRRALVLPRCARFAPAATELALVVALVWAVHPLATQAVTYVTQRYESLMGLFYLLTLYCALRAFASAAGGAWWKAAGVAACGLAMGSKEVAVTAPLLVLLCDSMLVSGGFRRAIEKHWPMYAGFAALWLLFAPLYRAGSGGKFAGFKIPISPQRYLCSEGSVLLHYLRLSLLPYRLCFDYCWPLAKTYAGAALLVAAVGLLVAATLWGLFRGNLAALLGAAFFLILSVTSSIVPISDLAVEYRMYLPLAAVMALVVLGGYWLADRWRERQPQAARTLFRALPLLAAAAVLVLGVQTALRNRAYEDSLTLWEDTVANGYFPNPRAWYSLALSIHETGDGKPETESEALPYVEKALAMSEKDADAHCLRGILLENLGHVEEAEKDFRAATKYGPTQAECWYDLANLLSKQGKMEESIPLYDRAVLCDDRDPTAYLNRGSNYMLLNRLADAERDLKQAILLDNSHTLWFVKLAAVLGQQGKFGEAIDFLRQYYPSDLRGPEYLMLIGALHAQRKDFAAAETAYRQALAIDRTDRGATLGLADLFSNQGRPQDAIALLRPLLHAAPDDASIWFGLGSALAKAGETEEAAEKLREALRLKPEFQRARQALDEIESRRPSAAGSQDERRASPPPGK